MSDLVKPFTDAQTDTNVKRVEGEGLVHKELVNVDEDVETAVSIGKHEPQDTTLSQEIAHDVVEKKSGIGGFFARLGQKLLNLVSSNHNHGTSATEADDIRDRIALNNANANLDKIDGNGSMVAELNKDIPIKN